MIDIDQELQDLERMVEAGGDGATLLRQFVQADLHRKELAAELKAAEQKCSELQAPVLQYMAEAGISSLRIDGKLLHIVKRFKVVPKEGKTKDDVCEALRNTGHSDIVTTSYHWTRMASLAKQADEDDIELPQELLDTIEVQEEFKAQTRK